MTVTLKQTYGSRAAIGWVVDITGIGPAPPLSQARFIYASARIMRILAIQRGARGATRPHLRPARGLYNARARNCALMHSVAAWGSRFFREFPAYELYGAARSARARACASAGFMRAVGSKEWPRAILQSIRSVNLSSGG